MTLFAKRPLWRVFLFGNNSLHMRWAASTNGDQLNTWQRVPSAREASSVICEGPWTKERALIFRQVLSVMAGPRLVIFSGGIALHERTVLEGILDHVDIFLPEGIEQFWRSDTQELVENFLRKKTRPVLLGEYSK